MRNIGYVIRLHGVPNRYAWGKTLSKARVYPTREAARKNKRQSAKWAAYIKPQQIFQVELTKNGKAKRIIKEVR